MNIEKKSFVMYMDWEKQFSCISDEQVGQVVRAIFCELNGGKSNIKNPVAQMAFSFIIEQIKRDCKKYEEICSKNKKTAQLREAKKAAKKSKPKIEEIMQISAADTKEKTIDFTGCNTENSTSSCLVSYSCSDTGTDYDTDTDTDYDTVPEPGADVDYAGTQCAHPQKESAEHANKTASLYNKICVSLPKVGALSATQKAAIAKASTALNGQTFGDIFRTAEDSDFLTGRNGGWKCNFDWIVNYQNIPKIMSGIYGNRSSKNDTMLECDRAFYANCNFDTLF